MSDLPEAPPPPDDEGAPAPVPALEHEPAPAPGPASGSGPSREPAKGESDVAPAVEAPRHVRCFLAVNFPLATVRRIADEIAALKGPVGASGLQVRWVPAANIHLTLKFLGPVRAPAIEALRASLSAGLAACRPFELEVRGVGAFPSASHPRVLWVGVKEEPALAALQREVDGWMAQLGFPPEERPYRPHATIGRVGGGHGDLAALLADREGRAFGGGRVHEVVIYESRTMARGAEYHALARVPLSRTVV